jgi:hypothetical protein
MCCAVLVTWLDEIRNAYSSETSWEVVILKKWEDNVKVDLRQVGCEDGTELN